MHTSVQVYLNNKLYKYGKYVSLRDWLAYTIQKYSINKITKQQLIDNAYDKDIITSALAKYSKDVFTFEEIYNFAMSYLPDELNAAGYIILINIVLSIIQIVDNYTKRLYYIPGCYDNFGYNKSNYSLFCYNMTDDKDEVVNLLDTKNYKSSNDVLFEQLNSILNSSTANNKMNPIFYISPYQVLIDTIENVKLSVVTGIIDFISLSKLSIASTLEVDVREYIRNDN